MHRIRASSKGEHTGEEGGNGGEFHCFARAIAVRARNIDLMASTLLAGDMKVDRMDVDAGSDKVTF